MNLNAGIFLLHNDMVINFQKVFRIYWHLNKYVEYSIISRKPVPCGTFLMYPIASGFLLHITRKFYEKKYPAAFPSAASDCSYLGFAFVAQSVGMDYVQPFTFTAARSLIGGIVLLPFIFIRAQKAGRTF